MIIILLIIIIFLLLHINSKIPPRNHLKEAIDRDKHNKRENN